MVRKKKWKKRGGVKKKATQPKIRPIRPIRKTKRQTKYQKNIEKTIPSIGYSGKIDIEPDGNCLFSSIGCCVGYSGEFVRSEIAKNLPKFRTRFYHLVERMDGERKQTAWKRVLKETRTNGIWGGSNHIQVASEIWGCSFRIFTVSREGKFQFWTDIWPFGKTPPVNEEKCPDYAFLYNSVHYDVLVKN